MLGGLTAFCASGLFQLLSEGSVPEQHPDWSGLGPEESCSMELTSPFPPLLSACGQPAYTNYVGGFHGCLDYVFIQPQSMKVPRIHRHLLILDGGRVTSAKSLEPVVV